jgi:murein L,D-transpeptidase YafK
MKKIVKIAFVVLFGVGVALASNQFLVFPWTSTDLPEMKNPHLRVTKSQRTLELFDGEQLVKTYKVALGSSPVEDKEIEGDGKTPEGEFYIFTKNPQSSFYLSLGLSYPNSEDAKRGLASNLISQVEHDRIVEAIENKSMPPQKTALGGEIYLHGSGNMADWTEGCVALTNADIKELFDALPVGTKVVINP